jgi:hypothetical protein
MPVTIISSLKWCLFLKFTVIIYKILLTFFLWPNGPTKTQAQAQAQAAVLLMFLDHTQRQTKVGRTPLDE